MKNSSVGMILKVFAAVFFLGGIGGGGFLAVTAVTGEADNWNRFAIGLILVGCAVFVIACIVPWIAHFDGQADRESEEGGATIISSLKTGLMFTFFAAVLIFVFIGIAFWSTRGLWQLGTAAIAALSVMIVIAVEASIMFQLRHSRRVLKNKNAEERVGKIVGVGGQFHVAFLGKKYFFIKVFYVETDGVKSQAFLRASNKTAKSLCQGEEVKIKIDMRHPRYCAITCNG